VYQVPDLIENKLLVLRNMQGHAKTAMGATPS